MARKMQNWKMGIQVAKTGKNYNETMLTDKGCSRTRPGRPLADISGGVSTGDLKGLKNCDNFESHVGKGRPFRPSFSGWTNLDLFGSWLDTQPGRLWRPWSRGFWWVFTFDNLAHIGITVQDEDRGLGKPPGRTLQDPAQVQIPGRALPGFLRLERTGAGVFDHIRWDLQGAIFKAVH